MKRSMLPLNALRAFDAAARHRSFKQAADELAVTPAAISQQIRTLEEFLGVELFQRSNRNLMLTDAARLALKPIDEGFDRLVEAVDSIKGTSRDTAVRVSVSPSFASKWLVPRLARYYERHPDAVVKINATMALTDFKSEEVDLAIRYGRGPYPGLEVRELLREVVTPMVSPDLLMDGKSIRSPQDLLDFTLIHDDSFSDDDSAPTWPMWLRAAGVRVPDGLPAIHFNTHMLAIEAAVAGRGVVLARSSIAEADVQAGKLIPVLGDAGQPVAFAHHVVAPFENLRHDHVRSFVDWLECEASGDISMDDCGDAGLSADAADPAMTI